MPRSRVTVGAVLAGCGLVAAIATSTSFSKLALLARGSSLLLVIAGALLACAPATRALWADAVAAGRRFGGRAERWDLAALVGLTAIGAVFRLRLLDREPMRYDESYTFLYFASKPLGEAMSQYPVPNNHVAHSVLMHITWKLFGDGEWALRLPAFLAGVLLVPALYVAGRMLYGRAAGMVAAALGAASSALVAYSVNGRGYTIICLAFVVLIALSARLQQRPRDGAAWTLWAAVAVLGLYTAPIMALPLSVVGAWLGLSALADRRAGPWWSRLAPLAAATAAVLVVAGILYWPLRDQRGFDYSWLVSPPLDELARSTVESWTYNVPVPVQLLLLGLAVAGLVLHRRVGRQRVPVAAGVLAVPIVVLVAGRTPPFERTWLFAVPLVLLLIGAGTQALLVALNAVRWPAIATPAACVAVALALGAAEPPGRAWADDLGYASDPDAIVRTIAESGTREPMLIDQRAVMTWAFYLTRHELINYPVSFKAASTPGAEQAALVPVHRPGALPEALRRVGLEPGEVRPAEVRRFPDSVLYRITY